jgi:4-cresol dehydrogenase (hydroxylating)
MNTILPKILDELRLIVGENNIKINSEVIAIYSRSTLSKGTTPVAIVFPENKEEIVSLLKVAEKYKLQIHPISTGKNWGYSDACAPTHGQVILSLERMTRIIEVNNDLGYATIEPGVTQGQLYTFLKENNIPLWMDATGAGMDTSIIGNVLERGFGHSPYGDRYAHSSGYEIVLPTGEILNTGFGNHRNSKVTEIYKWGVGPSIDGLFTQSNLGIVTKMTLWLLPKPEKFKILFFSLKEEENIIEFIEKIRPLKMDGTLRSVIHINNDLRMISTSQRFPFEEIGSDTYIPKNKRLELAKKHSLGFWTGTAGFYGSQKQVQADIARMKKVFHGYKGFKIFLFLDSYSLFFFEKILSFSENFYTSRALLPLYKKTKIAFDLLQGKSPESSILGGLWKTKLSKEESRLLTKNPLDYQSGFYWISPLLPMKGGEVTGLNHLIEPIFNKYGFDMLQTLSMVNERTLCAVLTICFNKKSKEESLRAETCHNELVQSLMDNGYIIYRSGNQSMKFLYEDNDTYAQFVKKIKKTIDPFGIISPGRYIPQ